MEENFNEQQEVEKESKSKKSIISTLLAIASLCIIVVIAIVGGFVLIQSGVFFGIMNIVILGLPIAGGILAYLDSKSLKSYEFILNVATLMVALLVF